MPSKRIGISLKIKKKSSPNFPQYLPNSDHQLGSQITKEKEGGTVMWKTL